MRRGERIPFYGMLVSLVVLVAAFPPAFPPQSRDIQAEINAAAKTGGTVVLPAGIYPISTPLVVPAGAHDLTICGAPEGTTIVPTALITKQAILVGVLPQLHNNWMITGKSNIQVAPVPEGQDYVMPVSAPQLGYYVLWDDYKIVCAKGPNVDMNHCEIVKVISYDASTGRAAIASRVGRDYGPNAYICPYDAAMCRNITISGISFRGAAPDGTISEGLAAVGICDGVKLQDLSVDGFRSDAIMTNTSRNVTVDRCRVVNASSGDAGSGYGISIYRSRFVTIRDSGASATRHSFVIHSGSMDVTLQRCHSANGFDTHGYDERRVALLYCDGDGGDIGNDAWLGGAKDVLVRGCTFSQPLGVHANVRGLRVVDTVLGGFAVYSVEEGTTPTVGVPAGGMADGMRVDRCTVNGTLTTQGATRFGSLAFTNSAFNRWGTVIDIANKPTAGHLELLGCTLSTTAETVVQFRNQTATFSFVMDGCKLVTQARTGIWVSSTFLGSGIVVNCTIQGPPGATLLADQSGRIETGVAK